MAPCQHRQEEIQQGRYERLERYSNLGPLASRTFDSTIERGVRPDQRSQEMFSQALGTARGYAQDAQGWLVFVGPSGSGKTHLAAAIAHERLRQDEPALFVFVPDLLDHLRAAYAPDAEMAYDTLFQQIREAPFLVLDDLGAQATTPWAQEKLFQVINHRFMARLPTVVTVGGSLDGLEARVQSRLTDPEVSRVCALAIEAGRWAVSDALVLPLFREMTFETFHPRRHGSAELKPDQRQSLEMAYKLAQSYAENSEGWLVLMGENGVGKTHLAAAIAHACRDRGTGVLFLIVPDLLDHLRYTFRPDSDVSYDELFEEVKRVPLLVLDDLGAHGTTPWAREKLYQIINYRYNARLPLVVTTNLSLDELERAEPRIASRLADTRFSVPFHIDAPNYGVSQPAQDGEESRGSRRRGDTWMDRRETSR